jgi:hypothetical protein
VASYVTSPVTPRHADPFEFKSAAREASAFGLPAPGNAEKRLWLAKVIGKKISKKMYSESELQLCCALIPAYR